jgi:hypothetical protein
MIEMTPRPIGISDALESLYPGSKWFIKNNKYSELTWLPENTISKPSEEELNAEVERLQAEHTATEYQRLRAKEYPPVTDYLDAVVKGDLVQQQTYIDACLVVKAKYPKPEGV